MDRPDPIGVVAGERQGEGRAVEPLLEPRRDQADDAGRPGLARDHHRRAPLLEAEREQRLRLGLGERRDLDLPPGAVQPVELGGDGARLEFVGRGEEARAERGVADPPAGVDPAARSGSRGDRAAAARRRPRRRRAPQVRAGGAAASPGAP